MLIPGDVDLSACTGCGRAKPKLVGETLIGCVGVADQMIRHRQRPEEAHRRGSNLISFLHPCSFRHSAAIKQRGPQCGRLYREEHRNSKYPVSRASRCWQFRYTDQEAEDCENNSRGGRNDTVNSHLTVKIWAMERIRVR